MKIPDIKNLKPSRISNPIEFEKRIFKCRSCKTFHYMPELAEGETCKECFSESQTSKSDRTTLPNAVEEIEPTSDGSQADDGGLGEDHGSEQG